MKTPRSLWWAPGPMSDQQHQFSQSQQYQITIPRKSYKNSDFISNTEYLPTFFWVRRDFCLGISENVPATSKDFRRFSEDLRTFPKISEDVPTNFEHLRSHLKGDKFSVFWKNYDNIMPLYEIFLWKLPELNFLYWSCVKCQFVRIYESGVGNCPWCVTSMPLIWSADM